MDSLGQGNKIMDLAYTPYRNFKGQPSTRFIFVYDSLDPTGTDFKTLFANSNYNLTDQGGHKGVIMGKGRFSFDTGMDIAKPKIPQKNFDKVKLEMNNGLYSGGNEIVTSIPQGSKDLISLHIIRADPNYAP
jgi:hypothetical protein